ncbi:hypothetical protein [Psychroflexus aestuariivivens]|uniref:hypothetical protein n=1 Tax=Psychroflexus aestuariivivens TaxID=1795040 RepID=UPI000FDAA9F6|nr:hypothetical protein [Psychroflexus aestuariivivens]
MKPFSKISFLLISFSISTFTFGQQLNSSEDQNIISPIYKGCETEANEKDSKKCQSKKIHNFLKKKLSFSKKDKKSLNAGMNRFYAKYKVDENAKITNIEILTPHKQVKDKIRKLIEKLEYTKPATFEDGTPTSVTQMVPINYYNQKKGPEFILLNSSLEITSDNLDIKSVYPVYDFKEKNNNVADYKSFNKTTELFLNAYNNFMDTSKLESYFESGRNEFKINFTLDKHGDFKNIEALVDNRILKLYLENALKNINKFSLAKVNGKPVSIDFTARLVYLNNK